MGLRKKENEKEEDEGDDDGEEGEDEEDIEEENVKAVVKVGKKEKKVKLSKLEEPLKTKKVLPKKVAMVTEAGPVISMHWHRERNKKSFGVRAVHSNGFTVEQKKQKKTKILSNQMVVVNTVYSSLFGLGSDAFNRFMTWFSPPHRSASSSIVFSEMLHLTLYLDIWALQQWGGKYKIPEKENSYGTAIFETFLRDLAIQLMQYATSLPTDPIFPRPIIQGCDCESCVARLEELDVLNIIARQEREVQEEEIAEEKRCQKEKEIREKNERKRKRREKKKESEESERSERSQKPRKRRKKSQKVSCLSCSSKIYKEKTLLCVACNAPTCSRCHGLKGRGVSNRRMSFLCSSCSK